MFRIQVDESKNSIRSMFDSAQHCIVVPTHFVWRRIGIELQPHADHQFRDAHPVGMLQDVVHSLLWTSGQAGEVAMNIPDLLPQQDLAR
jgi:hypothetical protein